MSRATLLKILDLARWAPSGDNTQPWRFEILADDCVIIHGRDTRDHILYDFAGHASHMAHGALLETLRIAASGFGMRATWQIESDAGMRLPRYRVQLQPVAGLPPDPLLPFIEKRVTQRRPMRMTPLDESQRLALIAAAGEDFAVQLFESFAQRRQVAALLWHNAHIRLTCPEAFPVHREIIEWGVRYSADRLPEQAVGVDPVTARLMRWAMQSWKRVDFLNRYLLGTVPPRIQLDYLPALFCAAHVLLRPRRPPQDLPDWLALGQAMQRLWLTVTQQGLHLQPQMTPVIFRWYARAGKKFSAQPALFDAAQRLTMRFEALAGANEKDAFGFFCRVGRSASPDSRSVRLSLEKLLRNQT